MSDAQSNITVVLEVMDFIQQMPGVKQNGFLSVKVIDYSTHELGKSNGISYTKFKTTVG